MSEPSFNASVPGMLQSHLSSGNAFSQDVVSRVGLGRNVTVQMVSDDDDRMKTKALSRGAIAGIATGAAVATLAVFAASVLAARRWRKRTRAGAVVHAVQPAAQPSLERTGTATSVASTGIASSRMVRMESWLPSGLKPRWAIGAAAPSAWVPGTNQPLPLLATPRPTAGQNPPAATSAPATPTYPSTASPVREADHLPPLAGDHLPPVYPVIGHTPPAVLASPFATASTLP